MIKPKPTFKIGQVVARTVIGGYEVYEKIIDVKWFDDGWGYCLHSKLTGDYKREEKLRSLSEFEKNGYEKTKTAVNVS